MSLKRRLEKLEQEREARQGFAYHVPWYVAPDGPEGITIDGEQMTWDEFERRYPRAPKPMRWLKGDTPKSTHEPKSR